MPQRENVLCGVNVAVMMCEYEDQSEEWWLALEFLNLVWVTFVRFVSKTIDK